jgi:hypothetical protein
MLTTTSSEVPGENTLNIWNPDRKKTITIPAAIKTIAHITGDVVVTPHDVTEYVTLLSTAYPNCCTRLSTMIPFQHRYIQVYKYYVCSAQRLIHEFVSDEVLIYY